jgi:hypothetical protein
MPEDEDEAYFSVEESRPSSPVSEIAELPPIAIEESTANPQSPKKVAMFPVSYSKFKASSAPSDLSLYFSDPLLIEDGVNANVPENSVDTQESIAEATMSSSEGVIPSENGVVLLSDHLLA